MLSVRLRACAAALLSLLMLAACESSKKEQGGADGRGSRYFASPQEAVEKATGMLRESRWADLAEYYDLRGSEVTRAELTSGRFFTRTEPPAGAHPGLPWKYRHPFTPGFKYHAHDDVAEMGVVQVTVMIEIDQGGGPPQRGFSSFFMRKSERGYQFMPRMNDGRAAAPAEEAERRAMLAGYQPKLGADSVTDLRPSLRPRIEALPPADAEHIVQLIAALEAMQRGGNDASASAGGELPPPTPTPLRIHGIDAYPATDRELLISEIGGRIESVLETTHPSKVAPRLEAAGVRQISVNYQQIVVRHADVMGSGRYFYAEPPVMKQLTLPRAKRPI